MPPDIKIKKEDIVKVAIKIIREKGWQRVNARSVAKELSCSTQPIYRVFGGMEGLFVAVAKEVKRMYIENATFFKNEEYRTAYYGVAYVEFALKEYNLFEFIFANKMVKYNDINEMARQPNSEGLIENFMKITGLSKEQARELHFKLWMSIHGLANMASVSGACIRKEEIVKYVLEVFEANVEFIRRRDADGCDKV